VLLPLVVALAVLLCIKQLRAVYQAILGPVSLIFFHFLSIKALMLRQYL